MPLFVKAGAILPVGQAVCCTDQYDFSDLMITVYPGCDGNFRIYEDAGDSYDYEIGAYATYDLLWNDLKRELTITALKGEYSGMADTRKLQVAIVGERGTTITFSGKETVIGL